MYRIIAGRWKSKRISAPKNIEVRPTTDFAKEALFSILEHKGFISSSRVLDLFGGIGSISLEFASRGASHVVCVEQNPKQLKFIYDTAKLLEMDEVLDIQRADVFTWLKRAKSSTGFDFIFADPPFDMEDEKYQNIVALIAQQNLLKDGGLLIIEHQSRRNPLEMYQPDIRKYGNVSFSLLKKEALDLPVPSVEE